MRRRVPGPLDLPNGNSLVDSADPYSGNPSIHLSSWSRPGQARVESRQEGCKAPIFKPPLNSIAEASLRLRGSVWVRSEKSLSRLESPPPPDAQSPVSL